MDHNSLLAPGFGLGGWRWRRRWCGAGDEPCLRAEHDGVAALLWQGGGSREYFVRCEALGEGLACAVGVDRSGEIEFGAIVQLEGLHGGGFAGRFSAKEARGRPAVESDADGFR